MSTMLEEVAATADEVADQQRQVARDARAMQRQRDRGWSWARILERSPGQGVFQRLRHGARLLTQASVRVAEALARGLSEEGESRRNIGKRLGVTHQRVSALVKGGGRSPRDE